MKNKNLTLQTLMGLSLLIPTVGLAKAPSRKIARDSSAAATTAAPAALKRDLVPVNVVVNPGTSAGIGARSYKQSPIVMTTGYVSTPQDNSGQLQMAMMAGVAMLAGSMKNMFGGESTNPSPASTAKMTDTQLDNSVYAPTSTTPSSTKSDPTIANLAVDAHDDEDSEVASAVILNGRKLDTKAYVGIMKRNDSTKFGQCLAPVKTLREAKQILVRNGVRVSKSANEQNIISLARGIQQIEIVNGGPSDVAKGATFVFTDKRGDSVQTAGSIRMNANHQDGNVAHLIHELGHYVGNRGLYQKYWGAVKAGSCYPTNYSKKVYPQYGPRREEFAEVWAAYITFPELLSESSQPGCRKAYEFLNSQFKQGSSYASCDPAKLQIAAQRLNGGDVQLASVADTESAATENGLN